MGRKVINMVGETFGRLVVLREDKQVGKNIYWLCQCQCGKKKPIRGDQLRAGETSSCGCLRKELNTLHGMTGTPEYKTWKSMKYRCLSKVDKDVKSYRLKMITVCNRWLNSFENFIEDMGLKPSASHSIERIENDKGYSPDNCKWATNSEQTRNKDNNIFIEYKGKKMILNDWSTYLNINKGTLHARLYKMKWSIEKAFTEPIHYRGK